MEKKFAVMRNGIHIDFLSVVDELGNHHRVERRYVGSFREVVLERGFFVDYVHCSAGKDIGGANEDRVGDALRERLGSVEGGDFGPFGLVDANGVEDCGELVPVFGSVDLGGVCTEDVDTRLLETEGDVLWELTYCGRTISTFVNHAMRR